MAAAEEAAELDHRSLTSYIEVLILRDLEAKGFTSLKRDREMTALGHEVRLIPAAYVKPYVKRGKTDAIDAEAICEAVSAANDALRSDQDGRLPSRRDAPEHEASSRQATNPGDQLPGGHLGELGIIAARGVGKVETLITIIRDKSDERLPAVARMALEMLADQVEALTQRIAALEHEIVAEVRRDDTMRRLATIPGVGPITAATIVALVPDPKAFTAGRHFAAWIGLTPKMHSTGGKDRIGRISKMGPPPLRSLLVVDATAISAHARRGATASPWLTGLLSRRLAKVAAIALANKMARIVWALLTKGGVYTRRPAAAATTWSAIPPSTRGKVHSINDDLHGTTSR